MLIHLVEVLQQRTCKGKIYRKNPSEIQMIMNVQMALDALKEDGVKMVNIGAHDIVEGNAKLILGLIWCLIQRYQINARTKIPAKKLMMAWLQWAAKYEFHVEVLNVKCVHKFVYNLSLRIFHAIC
ncbi:unnamed protein product [Toxocara canis]|uniref:Calponin-homology (CH) domain-containing protein n=1 Tax=Toxocara canis TaxID=6265 RepID=A0A183U530_TOXCA|nr:unnamed protein product [Toxocara canis]